MKYNHRGYKKLSALREKIAFVALALVMGGASQVSAQTVTLDSNSTLEDYLRFAAKNNPATLSAGYRYESAHAGVSAAGALPNPRISYSHFLESVETRVGPQRRKLSISQTIPWFGSLGAQGVAAEANAEALNATRSDIWNNIEVKIRHLYFEIYFQNQLAEIIAEHLSLLGALESVGQRKYSVGQISQSKLLSLQMERARLADEEITVGENINRLSAVLNATLNRPLSETIYLNTTPDTIDVLDTEQNLRIKLMNQNPLLSRANSLHEMAKAKESWAGKRSLPSFTFGFDYIDIDEAVMPGVTESGKDAYAVRIGMSLPLWFGKNSSRTRSARAFKEAARESVVKVERELDQRLSELRFEVKEALRKSKLFKSSLIPLARQSMFLIKKSFETGDVDFRHLIDSQRELLDYQSQYHRQIANYNQYLARLNALLGKSSIDEDWSALEK